MRELKGIKYIERKPIFNTDHPPLIVLIHGYGSNEEDLFSFTRDMPDEAYIVSVRGINDISYEGFAWYDISYEGSDKLMDIDQAIESKNRLLAFIEELISKEQLDCKNVTLVGFSQGAILSYAVALNNPKKIKNVAILSGYPELKIIGNIEKDNDYSNLNFFISHGTEDIVLPIDLGRIGEELIKLLGIKFEYHEYQSGHSVISQNYFDLINWIKSSI